MSTNDEVLLGGSDGEFVRIRRVSANGPELWFGTEIEVQCDGWRGSFAASFMQGELTRFAREVRTLQRSLKGKATLLPLEPNLTLSLAGDGKGHVQIDGTARNRFGSGTKLSFQMEVDQTYLLGIAKSLEEIDP
jgi:hypothetical protein